MARKVFYSFHYDQDGARVSQVRSMGVVEGSPIATDHEWQSIKRGGDKAIQAWIDGQMKGTSCCVVLIGKATANREWVNYGIDQAWKQGKGVLGVHIYELKNLQAEKSRRGLNPLTTSPTPGGAVSTLANTYDPPQVDSKEVYAHIKANLAKWIDEAVEIRSRAS